MKEAIIYITEEQHANTQTLDTIVDEKILEATKDLQGEYTVRISQVLKCVTGGYHYIIQLI
jgi:hypothetical protein